MRRAIRFILLLGFGFLFCSVAMYAQETTATSTISNATLTNIDVVKMVEAKLSDELIVSKIRSSPSNYDTSIDAILKLKAAGVSDALVRAMVETSGMAKPAASEPPPNPNDPKSPHDPGIYWFSKNQSELRLVRLAPTSYSQAKTGGMFGAAMTGGIKGVSSKAVLPGPKAGQRSDESAPEFWFYFGDNPQGFQSSPLTAQASKPDEFVLAKMEHNGKERTLVVGQTSTFGGVSAGTRRQDAVPVDVQNIAPGIYKVTPAKPLQPGEYCFVPPGGAVGFGYAGGPTL